MYLYKSHLYKPNELSNPLDIMSWKGFKDG